MGSEIETGIHSFKFVSKVWIDLVKPRLKESLGTNLLVSFLIRYPHLSSLRYNRQSGSLSFTILLKGVITPQRQEEFVSFAEGYFAACRELDARFSPMGDVTHTSIEGVTMLVYEQPVALLNVGEIRLFMQLVADFYKNAVSDEMVQMPAEELNAQEEIIEHILGQKEAWCDEKLIVAYRDGGKVFVYNK
jgi:hypothetical protein